MLKIKSCIHSSSLDLKYTFLKNIYILVNQYGTPGVMKKDVELICQQPTSPTKGKPLNLSLIGTSKMYRNSSYIIKLVDGVNLGIHCVSSQ